MAAINGLTEAKRLTLACALELETEHDAAIFPRRGQHQMFDTLVLLGLLFFDGPGVDMNDHHKDVSLYRLTNAGRAIAKLAGA